MNAPYASAVRAESTWNRLLDERTPATDPVSAWRRMVDAVRSGDAIGAARAAMDLAACRRNGAQRPDCVPVYAWLYMRDFAKVCAAVDAAD